jgi:iron(III) transport system substrate-binding protein
MIAHSTWLNVLLGALVLWALGGCRPAASNTVAPSGAPASTPSVQQPTPATNPELQALIDAARREGQLTFVWGEGTFGGSEGIKRLVEGFNRTYGLNINVQFTPGPSMSEMSPRIVREYQAGRTASTDVLIGYDSQMAPAIEANALEPVDWLSWAPSIRNPALVAPNGMAVTVQTATPGITYNSARLTGEAIPRTMQDLLKPQYKGRIASTPYAANFDRLSTDALWGEQRAFQYTAQLADQLAGLIRCNETERVASGEFEIFALDCSQSNAIATKEKGAPVAFVIPSDAALLLYIYIAVPRTAPHPNAAKLWVNYMLSREVQDFLFESEFVDSHLVEGSKTAQEIERLQATGVKFFVSNIEFIQQNDVAEMGRRLSRAQEILRKQ